jgi:molybdate transport system substrate-binding protein
MNRLICVLTAICAFGIMTVLSSAHAREKIKVLSDGPLRPALVPIAEAFGRESGYEIEYVFDTSPVIHKRIADGETADVLIIQPNFVAELVKSGRVVPGEHPVIGRVGFGLAARADAPAHDIGTVEAFRQVLLNADSLIFNNVASGNYFATVLDRLNIAEAVKAKVVRIPPAAVFERVRTGKGNDIGVGTIPQIIADKSLRLIGPLPAGLQSHIVYAAAPMSNAPSPKAAAAFIAFLASPAAKTLFAANMVEPGGAR